MLIFIVVLSFIGLAHGQVECRDDDGNPIEDGYYGIGCRAYTVCLNGMAYNVECVIGEVFNPDLDPPGCGPKSEAPPPCGTVRDCNNPDGWYAVYEPCCDYGHIGCDCDDGEECCGWYPCQLFYSCVGGNDMGTEQCPDGLVFDPSLSMCNWDFLVPPPCGTYTGTTPWPTEEPDK